MAVYTTLDRRTLQGLATQFGLGKLSRSIGVAAGSVNTYYLLESLKGKYFLKIDEVKTEDEARCEVDLVLFLRQQGFPCPRPLHDSRGGYFAQYGEKPVSVYASLAGKTLTEAQLTPEHLGHVGETLASLHLVGLGYKPIIENRFGFDQIRACYEAMRDRIVSYFRHIAPTLDDEIAHQEQYHEERLPSGIIHGDLFADNLRFRAGKVSGVLDFEAACHGKFIFDIATAVNALCYSDGQYHIERFTPLIDGYQRMRTLSLIEWDAFPNELRFSALRFTVTRLRDFFFRHDEPRLRVKRNFREFLARLRVLRREQAGGMDRLLMAMATGYDYRTYQKPPSQTKLGERKPARKRERKSMGGRRY